MSTGVYGVKREATVDVSDIDIFYTFSPSRENITTGSVNKLNPNDVLTPVKHPDNNNQILGGLYSLKLPSDQFNIKGFYNIIIRPKSFITKIVDCGVLAALPDVKGILIDTLREDLADFQSKLVNGGLTGYKIEYSEADGSKTLNLFRIITSSNRCEPIVDSVNNVNQKSIKYRFSSNGSLVFLTVTPSSAPSIKPNSIPNIGQVNQSIIISNTFFDPLMIELELVEHDHTTIATLLEGNQVKDLSSGLRSVFDAENNIFRQWNEFEIRNEFNQPTHEVRERRKTLDNSQIFSDIIAGL